MAPERRAVALLCAHIMVKNVFVIPKSPLGSFAICFFSTLYPFLLTPLSHCVALYPGAGSGPCSLDPFCLHGQLAYPPPSHTASGARLRDEGF